MRQPTLSIVAREWLEADGLGGFASGTSTGLRTRRYHALLLTATTPPTGRVVLVNGFDAWVETASGTFSLSSQCYSPDVIGGDGAQRIEAFGWEPWPHWIFKLEDGTRIELELFAVKGEPMTCLSWKPLGPRREVKLFVRPFLSGRDYHSLHKSNPVFRFDAEVKPDRVSWQPYHDVPGVTALTNGGYSHQPNWYHNFLYEDERARGLDCEEDLAAPGVLSWNLADGKAALVLTTKEHAAALLPARVKPVELLNKLRAVEQKRRDQFPSRLHRAADAYIVSRSSRREEAQTFCPRNTRKDANEKELFCWSLSRRRWLTASADKLSIRLRSTARRHVIHPCCTASRRRNCFLEPLPSVCGSNGSCFSSWRIQTCHLRLVFQSARSSVSA